MSRFFHLRAVSWLAAFCLFSGSLHASDAHAQRVQTLMQHSGVKEAITAFPEFLKIGIHNGAAQAGMTDASQLEPLDKLVDTAWAPEPALALIEKVLSERLPDAVLDDVNRWLMSPLGARITRMEVAASQVSAIPDMETQAPALVKRFKGSAREKQFEVFDRVTQSTAVAVDTAMAVQLAMSVAMLTNAGQKPEVAYEQVSEHIEANRFMLRGMITQQIFLSYLYTYRELTDEELHSYLEFARTDSGQKYLHAMHQAMKEAMIKPARTLGQEMPKALAPG